MYTTDRYHIACSPDFFRFANQMRCEKMYVQGEKPVFNEELYLDKRTKQAASQVQSLTGMWTPFTEAYPVECPATHIIWAGHQGHQANDM